MSLIAVLFAIALTAWSAWRMRGHGFREWWQAEGLVVWMMGAVIFFALLTSRFHFPAETGGRWSLLRVAHQSTA